MINWATQQLISLAERGLLPDSVIRYGIRRLLAQRIAGLPIGDAISADAYLSRFMNDLGKSVIAPLAEKANQQHYEVPTAFFQKALGLRLKYSSCFWDETVQTLDEAEVTALRITCEHANLTDGQDILELGCGWGSLTLWMAEHYPNSRIVAVSNSRPQRAFISERAAERGLVNVEVLTRDMNEFDIDRRVDRIVSVEMFEHMRNWPDLFGRVASWLKPEGQFFMHVFCHRALPYPFEVNDESDWMSQFFFSGGMMPSYELPMQIDSPLQNIAHWQWNGQHYQKTANAWLANMDAHKVELWPILEQTYGADNVAVWWVRWRIFFMACAELFGYDRGTEWLVGHYLFDTAIRSDKPSAHSP